MFVLGWGDRATILRLGQDIKGICFLTPNNLLTLTPDNSDLNSPHAHSFHNARYWFLAGCCGHFTGGLCGLFQKP